MVRLGCIALAGVLAVPSTSLAEARTVAPEKKTRAQRRAEARARDMSQGGERRGGIEIALGSLALGLSLVLVGRGTWEIFNARELERLCRERPDDPQCRTASDPVLGAKVAAGLSFAFAVPVAIGGGFLLGHGVRIRRDWRAWHRRHGVAVLPSAGPRGGGLALRFRF